MMNGVEIIEETTNIITETQNALAGAGTAIAITIVSLVVMALILSHFFGEPNEGCAVIMVLTAIVGASVGCYVGSHYVMQEVPVGTEVIYEVSISDDVRFNEFTQKYQIIEWKDSTVVVKERPEPPERPLYAGATAGNLDG